MKFIRNLIFILILVFITENAECDNFPSSIERCKYEDNKCLLESWNKYLKFSANPNGIPEFGIPNLHSFCLPFASISPGAGPLDVDLKMRNINLTGFDDSIIDSITGFLKDPKQMTKFELSGHIPHIGIKGRYNVTGKVLLLPVAGDDEGEVQFFNVKVNVTAYTSTKMVDGKEFLVITKVGCSYNTERNHYRFENLLNNKEISDGINNIINENQVILNNEVRPSVAKVLAGIFKKWFSSVFKNYPYSSFFLDA